MTATNQEPLQEAAKCYQSIVSTFPDEVFVRMMDYLKKQFPKSVWTPEDVRYSIKQIREHLGRLEPWEREVIRLEEDLMRRCQEHSDIPIYVSTEERAENLASDERQYFEEEYTMKFAIGTKVKRVLGINEIDEGVIIRYGVVLANQWAYVVARDPFDESTMHDYKKFQELRPKREDFESWETYTSAIHEHDKNEIARQALIVSLAGQVFVEWRNCYGKKVCDGWSPAGQLREYTEEDAKVDASLQQKPSPDGSETVTT